ncbi:MAG: hypothetical protein E6J90_28460 [Deltaproteobacteria bacterium]|nr:MAG: hypothetical protein E6J90_28460 [Deltaproteobacteria bacterium]
MTAQDNLLARLRRKNAMLRGGQPDIFDEGLQERADKPLEQLVLEESIAMLRLRPVLPIKNNQLALEFVDNDDRRNWKARLELTVAAANAAIPSVGRIELSGSRFAWIGTGWLVAEDILVTNRHVALEFTQRRGQRFAFQPGIDVGTMNAHVDFVQEIGNTKRALLFQLTRPLWIQDKPGPDIAFFEIARTSDNDAKLATPLDLAERPAATDDAATIGYPAYDSRIPQPEHMRRIFSDIYDKKRFAPGVVVRVTDSQMEHDCTTLGGNSGSVVLDLKTGKAIGLHFSGTYLDRNYAVPSNVVHSLLDRVTSGKVWIETSTLPRESARGSAERSARIDGVGRGSATVTKEADIAEETAIEDYRDRTGYDDDFLLDDKNRAVKVELPTLAEDGDVLTFELDGKRQTNLRYEHYSVIMSKSRRMCLLSAVNIDGNLARKAKRVSWKWDPRIPKSQQIMHECYGSAPKFSRGHMTRREDPGWGSRQEAKRGNEDSMHVTNTCPQMQAFNSPIWLALEDYALQHAKEDRMRISVFTGPYFDDADPTMFDVGIPLAFWKVIAFIHDLTRTLCATGYEMNQEQNLHPTEEFVFGQFRSRQLNCATQVPIRAIEFRCGIDFGRLASVDPLARDEEALGSGERVPLTSLDEIRFF